MSTDTVERTDSGLPVSLFGEDPLTPVEDLPRESKEKELRPEASTEGFHSGISNNDPKDCSSCGTPNWVLQRPPCVSRIIDKSGRKLISIILGSYERVAPALPIVTGIIDSATERDVVDITLVDCNVNARLVRARSILSAITRCRGHVIVRAGMIHQMDDLAIWLSAKERRLSPIGCIFLNQPEVGFIGDGADYETNTTDLKEVFEEYRDFIAEKGIFTKEELDQMYEERKELALFGEELQKRMSHLQANN